jgi:hypothetical protein
MAVSTRIRRYGTSGTEEDHKRMEAAGAKDNPAVGTIADEAAALLRGDVSE